MKYFALILVSLFLSFLIGMKYEQDSHQGEIITVYTPVDIIYADFYNLQIVYEVSNDIHNFTDRQQLIDFLENQSAEFAQGMKEYQIQLDMDTIYVYQYGKYIDCYITEEPLNQFDEILALDNQ